MRERLSSRVREKLEGGEGGGGNKESERGGGRERESEREGKSYYGLCPATYFKRLPKIQVSELTANWTSEFIYRIHTYKSTISNIKTRNSP